MIKNMQRPDPCREKEDMKHSPYRGKYLVYILGKQNWKTRTECERTVLVCNILVAPGPSSSVNTIKAAQLEFVAHCVISL